MSFSFYVSFGRDNYSRNFYLLLASLFARRIEAFYL